MRCDGICRTNIRTVESWKTVGFCRTAQTSIISFPSNNIAWFWGFCCHRTLCNLAHAPWTCPEKPPSIGPIALSCHDSACPSAEGAVSGKMAGLGRWVWKCLESPVIWHSRVLCEIGTYLFESCLYPWTSFWTGKNTWQPLDLCNIWCLWVIMNHNFCLLTGLGRETQEFSQGEHPQGETLQLKVSWIGGTSKSSNNIQYTLVTYGGKSRFNMF